MRVVVVIVAAALGFCALAPAFGVGLPPLLSRRSCPADLRALNADSVAVAARVALRAEKPSDRPVLLGAARADHGGARGSVVRGNCGRKVWHRTVSVSIELRRYLPSASLSQRVSFVGRTARGYGVYALGH